MGDITIANQLIDGVRSALAAVGDTTTFRILNQTTVDINNPTVDPGNTPEDVTLEAFLFDFTQSYMPEANIAEGDTMAIIDIKDLTEAQVNEIVNGNLLVNQSVEYTIVNNVKIQVAGKPVTFILQLR